jgi:N,N'-diacetyllegionaminate synthase
MEIIVDLFNQHSGDMKELKRMALSAFTNGADVVKTQIIDSKRIWGDDSRKYLEMSYSEVEEFSDYCRTIGIEFMTTVFNEDHIPWLDKLEISRYKIASITSASKSQDPEGDKILCNELMSRNAETLVSLGFSDLDSFEYSKYKNIKYLFCVPKYPTNLFDPDLKKMPIRFNQVEGDYYGFSDHTLGTSAALLSFLNGASILEKHFSMGNFRQGEMEKAHLCSFTPESLSSFKNQITELDMLINK